MPSQINCKQPDLNGFEVVKTPKGGYIAKLPDGTPVYYETVYRKFYQWCCSTSVAAVEMGNGNYTLKNQS